ncbi:MAG: hypothetical protein IBX62_07240 [Coriobacteriia bacterium]|nr:hypothetical protein [Coriobacteriia bacterium]
MTVSMKTGVRVLIVIGLAALMLMAWGAGVARAELTTADCITCHGNTDVHVDISCYGWGCHGADEYGTGTWPFSYSDHNYEPCTQWCHSSAYPDRDGHSDDEVDAIHPVPEACLDCHSFIADHSSCYQCHTSTDPKVLAAIEADDPSCDACHDASHGNLLSQDAFNPSHPGYLDWDTASTFAGNTGTSPHGGYSATTNKCAVCHSVHRATPGGSVLTAGGPYATYAQGCVFCHGIGATFTDVVITADADGYISPHGTCSRCHALNPHGVGASEYVTLASKLINKNADTWIAQDLAVPGKNGLDAGMFDGTGDLATGVTLGTGYLCGNCHNQAFAVNVAGTDPATPGAFSGHRVTAVATAAYSGPSYGASFTGAPVAFAHANGCTACHDALTASNDTAFPHGYVDAAGAITPKTVAGSSYIWLTYAEDALAAKTLLTKTNVPGTNLENTELLTNDGLCLKCHRDGAGAGVGLSY